jgi:hypothetical protein
MNDGENPVQIILFLLSVFILWLVWYGNIIHIHPLASGHADRLTLYLAPPICVLFLLISGMQTSAHDLGMRWRMTHFSCEALVLAVVALSCFPFFGLSPRLDVAERRNRCAGWAIAGALLGLTLQMAKIAPGVSSPGRWTNDFYLRLSDPIPGTLAFLAIWAAFDMLTALPEAITVDRDGGAALRLATFLIAIGIALGQSLLELSTFHQEPLSESQEQCRIARIAEPVVLFCVAVSIELVRRKRHPGRPGWVDIAIAAVYVVGTCNWASATA